MKNVFSTLALLFVIHFASYGQTVVDIVVNSPDHNTLETAVIAAELADDLSGEGPFTVFAPTDAAFAMIDPAVLEALLADPTGDLATILLFHVTSGVADGSNIMDGTAIGSLMGQNLTFGIDANGVSINGVNVSVVDIKAENGVVHVIDGVLLPQAPEAPRPATIMDIVEGSDVHTTLASLISAAELDDDLRSSGAFTLFAPTDDAFAALPQEVVDALTADPTGALADVLLYHAVSGVADTGNIMDGLTIGSLSQRNLTFSATANGVSVNGVNIIITDLRADNGVVHVLDAVLVP